MKRRKLEIILNDQFLFLLFVSNIIVILFFFFRDAIKKYFMNEKEKLLKEINSKKFYELDLPKFYDTLTKAINSNNLQSVYELSKIFTRYYFKDLDS